MEYFAGTTLSQAQQNNRLRRKIPTPGRGWGWPISDKLGSTSKLWIHKMDHPHRNSKLAAILLAATISAPQSLHALPQHSTALQPDNSAPHRTRLILKDGSYQVIMSYRIVGDVVHYISAERGGADEEIPLSLVDLDATKRWDLLRRQAERQCRSVAAVDPL